MNWLTNLKIKHKIFLMLFFPVIGLLYFSLLMVMERYHLAQEMDRLEDMATVAVKVADLIHQVQLERLISVKFLKKRGEQLVGDLEEEQLRTDRVINELKTLLTTFQTEEWGSNFQVAKEEVFTTLQGLTTQREAIRALHISEMKMIDEYGHVNVVLIDLIKQIATLTTNKEVFTLELAYVNFIAAKELTALERSTLVNVLTQKFFEAGEFQKFITLIAQQQVYRRIIFMFLASEEQQAFFNQTVTGEAVEEAQRIRDLVSKTASEGLIENVDPKSWEENQTRKIELLKKVETRLGEDLSEQAHLIQSQAYKEFTFALFMVATLLGLAALLVIVILRGITHRLSQAVEVANAIAVGNLNNQIEVSTQDETGQLLQAFVSMQGRLSDQIEKEINVVIQAASLGDFKQQISLEEKSGFFKTLSESINQIMAFNQGMIEDIMRIFAALVQGDLSQKIENSYVGAFEQLKSDANATVMKLMEIMTEISQAAEVVSTAADEISQGNTSLSQRTEQQAASLEETAASMEQMTSSVQQTANNTKQAIQLALSAKTQAEKGGEVVGTAISAMEEINNSSKRIKDIIVVIDEIAFQTNLLALNAAVEAARAGEQGRGFAVVASEVRNLAQRSAAAAKEIKELIQDSVMKVEEGSRLANESGETLAKIVTAVTQVNDIIAEITAASQEQSSGINQVNKAITQMDEMTQQNAALVEEAAAASESMSDQAQTLRQKVSFFNLGDALIVPQSMKSRPVVNHLAHQQSVVPRRSVSQASRHESEWEDF